MNKLDLSIYRHVHFIGIGGISMSGLAEILMDRGMKVSGSDVTETPITQHLKGLGIIVNIPHNAGNIQDGTDLVVYTAAVKKDNAEILEAERRSLKIIDRAQLLGVMMEEYSCPICISGTHGKTSTTSMISEIFLDAGCNPTISSGGVVVPINSSFHVGGKDIFIVESCEYFNSFLKFFPKIGVILNIDADHLDFFGDMETLQNAFASFAKNVKSDGTLVINNNIPNLDSVISGLSCNIVTFGNECADWNAADFNFDSAGLPEFAVYRRGENLCRVKLKVPGMHNVMNALAAFAASYEYGLSAAEISKGLESFAGTKRRYEYKGTFNGGTVIIDDYAHHPTEIRATLETAKQSAKGNVRCLFQPHTYSRTERHFDEFAAALAIADEVVVLDIYAAREQNEHGIGSKDLADRINDIYVEKARFFPSFEEAANYFIKNCFPSDVLITMGAGDVHLVGEHILST